MPVHVTAFRTRSLAARTIRDTIAGPLTQPCLEREGPTEGSSIGRYSVVRQSLSVAQFSIASASSDCVCSLRDPALAFWFASRLSPSAVPLVLCTPVALCLALLAVRRRFVPRGVAAAAALHPGGLRPSGRLFVPRPHAACL